MISLLLAPLIVSSSPNQEPARKDISAGERVANVVSDGKPAVFRFTAEKGDLIQGCVTKSNKEFMELNLIGPNGDAVGGSRRLYQYVRNFVFLAEETGEHSFQIVSSDFESAEVHLFLGLVEPHPDSLDNQVA